MHQASPPPQPHRGPMLFTSATRVKRERGGPTTKPPRHPIWWPNAPCPADSHCPRLTSAAQSTRGPQVQATTQLSPARLPISSPASLPAGGEG